MTEIILSISKKWADKILKGFKTVEVRKNAPQPSERHPAPFMAYLYETKENGGRGMIVGHVEIIGYRRIESYDEQVSSTTMMTKEEYQDYARCQSVMGWQLARPLSYMNPKPLAEFGLRRPPQSWCYVPDLDDLGGSDEPDDLEEIKMILSEPDESLCIGYCKYCGQASTVEGGDKMTQGEKDKAATARCSCPGGEMSAKIDRASDEIESLYPEASDDLRDYLIHTAQMVVSGQADKATVDIDGKVKAKFSMDGKGKIIIQRNDSFSNRREI